MSRVAWDFFWVSTYASLTLALVACWLTSPNLTVSRRHRKLAFARVSFRRHLNDIVYWAFVSANITVTKETVGLSRVDDKRLDGLVNYSLHGKPVVQ